MTSKTPATQARKTAADGAPGVGLRMKAAKPRVAGRDEGRPEQRSGAAAGKNQTGTQAIDRAMAVLFAFSTDRPAWRAVALAQELKLNKSTVYRLLLALAEAGLLRRPADSTGVYRLGPAVLDLSNTFLSNLDLRAEARPYIEQLVRDHGESINLAVMNGTDAIKIDSALGTKTPQLMSRLGQRIPLVCSAAGKALLFDHPDDALRGLFRTSPMAALTKATITKPSTFVKMMAHWREAGWASNDEESEIGIRAIGAPIRDHSGRIIASVSLSAPIFRVDDAMLAVLGEAVREAGNRISAAMGNRGRAVQFTGATF